ncbi:MAG: pre-peptidase C-terminal domain-containing protein [Akkermansiaceae bacterium]|nr:pre-peptidase C-terminal domain-containing protein [Akkermansiaceae bacterium]
MRVFPITALLLAVCLTANAEPGQSASHVAYVYPAGAQQGATIEVTAAGRGLRGVKEVFVTGDGVKATYVLSFSNYKKTYADYLKQLQRDIRRKEGTARRKGNKKPDQKKKKNQGPEVVVPPDHPIFRDLKKCTFEQLGALLRRHYKESQQQNRELEELCLIRVTVSPDAAPGMREMRLLTGNGISNPMRFYIGEKPEALEVEPNDTAAINQTLAPPFVINGQITAGDIDRFKFNAKAGQQLLIQGHARAIIPYIADAVPGWFQATLTLYDESGKEVAYADDYRFSPDPVLFYKIPKDACYTVEIRDSIYRGREDFVYRIAVGEDPFITSIFPLGGSHGHRTRVTLSGWNLPTRQAELDVAQDPGTIQQFSLAHSNQIPYAVGDLPEEFETPGNDSVSTAQSISAHTIVNGRIESPGDKDVYRFKGRAGDQVIVEIHARRLHSPMDSMLRLTDAKGKVIAWNDDAGQLNVGMLTHHADSKLSAHLPKEGNYYIHVSDTQNQGGQEYGYRLRVSRPRPDFSVSATPSSITVRQACTVPINVHVVRKDGFDGDIDIILKDAPKGFRLAGATIPSGCDQMTMTLTAPTGVKNTLFHVRLQARAKVGRQTVTRSVVPCEGMTQAFITEHIMPSEQTTVFVSGWGEAPEVILSKNAKVSIRPGGSTKLRIKKTKSDGSLVMKLYQAPDGITLEQNRSGKNALSVSLKASEKMKPGTAGNLMIEVFREFNKKGKNTRLQSIGVMPAFPFIIE